MTNSKLLLVLLFLGINLVSSAYNDEPAKYREEEKIPASNNEDYDRKDGDREPDLDGNIYSLRVASSYSDDDDESKATGFKKPSSYDDVPLSRFYYYRSCPDFEGIVRRKMDEYVEEDKTIAASLMRLHFHDCVVRGCDGSVLLEGVGSEREAKASKTLRGFEVIDAIKAEVEAACKNTVSCADILTAAARDATVITGGQYWTVDYGRKDGVVSRAEEADSLVPVGRETVTSMVETFQSMGLNLVDLVTLSGAHTIGRSSCGAIQYWLYNRTALPYSSIDGKYFDYLQRRCRWASDYVELDAKTPNTFDNQYFVNLASRNYKLGLLPTDRALYSDPRTDDIVKTFADDGYTFFQQFKTSMAKLGSVGVLTGPYEGEIRAKCSSVNSRY